MTTNYNTIQLPFYNRLKWKALLGIVLLSLIVSASIFVPMSSASRKNALKVQENELYHLAQNTSTVASIHILQNQHDELKSFIAEATDGYPLEYVIVFDKDKNVIMSASADDPQIKSYVLTAGQTVHRNLVAGKILPQHEIIPDKELLEIYFPIMGNNAGQSIQSSSYLLGYIRAGCLIPDGDSFASTLNTTIGYTLIMIGIIMLAGYVLISHIIRPLTKLQKNMMLFANGKLDVRCEVKRNDELGILSRVFNLMADQHQQALNKIIEMNNNLEKQVSDRTKKLEEIASRDFLTGLYNRRFFHEVLLQSFSQSLRYDHDISCIMIDVDNFKTINDKHGHPMGDKILQLLAREIKAQLRGSDVAARFGGDEFVILLPQANLPHASIIANRILDSFYESMKAYKFSNEIGLSIGMSCRISSGIKKPHDLIQEADEAMYKIKESGKNGIGSSDQLIFNQDSPELVNVPE